MLLLAAILVGQLPAASLQSVLAASNYSPAILSDAPSAYWRLGETSGTTAADSTTHNNTLTYQGGFTLGIAGAVKGDPNFAAAFNGTTAVATQTKSPLTAVANWTLEAWVNPSTLPQLGLIAYNGIKDTSQGGYGFGIGTVSFTSGSKLIGVLGSVATIDSGYSFAAPNQWYHVVMTRDTTTIRFYVNGKQTATTSAAAPTAPGARSSIGAGVNLAAAAVNGFAGSVDEAAVYPTALSAGRINAHYQEGASATSGLGNWATQSPTGPPSVRYEPAMGWDAGHNKVVLFGGQSSGGAAIRETWTWNGTAWTKLTPATQPSARWGAKLVYDTAINKMVLFGGNSGSAALSDTWTWDGTTWASVSPTKVPPARYEYGLAYDKTNSVVVMFGGFTKTTYLQDTYTFNGTNWTLKSPAAKPTIRARTAMAYQDSNNKTLLFGGVNGTTYNAETWLWDGTNWTQQTPNAAPSARAGSGLAYDPITLTSVLIGGVNGSSYFGDTWTWDGTNWSRQNTTTSPTVRAGAGFAYNGITFNGALFGGLSGSTYLGDTLAWNTPPAAPSPVTATAGNTQATITWTAPSSGGRAITGYKVVPYVGTTAGATTSVGAASTTTTITGLTNGTAYTFTVAATNATGTGAVGTSNAVTPATVPGAPTNVTGTAGNTQVTVNWTAPVSNGGSAITRYTATSAPGGFTANAGGGATSAVVTGLTNGTSYTFTVTATNAVGVGPASAPSPAVTPATVPGVPTAVSAAGGNGQATVTWTAPASNGGSAITGYTVTSSPGGVVANAGGSATSATVTALINGTSYTFTVTATNGTGIGPASSPSNAVTPATVPGAPTNVTAIGGNAQAAVSWTAPASNGGSAITRYDITPYIGTTAGKPTTVSGTTTSTTVTGLVNGTTYTFKVTATSAIGTGPASSPSAAVTPATVPGAPTGVSATAGNAQATVTWTAPASNGGAAITGYTVTSSPGGFTANAGGSATSATVPGLSNGTSYTFTVTATNSAGSSPASSPSNAVTPAAIPGAPTGVTASAGNAQATVSWTAAAANGSAITSYAVTPYIGASAGTPVNVSGTTTSTTLTGLVNGTTYTFQVTATNGIGTGPAGTSSAVTPTGPPYAPSNVVAVGGDAQATVTWTAPGNGGSAVTGYTITSYVGSTAGTPSSAAASATSATITGLLNGTTYTFQVTATSALGTGAAGTSNAVTPATVPQPPGSVAATGGNTQAFVTWTAPPNGGAAITGYTVTPYVGTTAGTPVSAGASATGATVTGLVNGTTYTFQVVATNALGNSSPGTSAAVTVGTPPGPPTSVTATPGNSQVTVSWTAPANNGGLAITTYTVTPYIGTTAGTPVTTDGSTTTKVVTGLNNGATYTFQVTAASGLGTSAPGTSNAATPASVPDAPGTVTATGASGQGTVSWTTPANGGAVITGYTITPFVGSTAATPSSAGPSATTTTITGLVNGTTYTFQVVATNVMGNSAPGASNAVTVGTPPGPPTNVVATSGNALAVVTWTAPASNGGSTITSYIVTPYIGPAAGTPMTVDGATTTATVTPLVNGTTYTIQVTATNAIGTSTAGASNSVTPATVPQAPGSVAATAGNTQAIVTWTAPANGGSAITGYTITPYVGTTAGTLVTAGASATSATVTGLVNGTTYTFQVFATNAAGNGAAATSNAVTPAQPPGPPTNVVATPGNAQAAVTWAAPSSNGGLTITGYTVTPYAGATAGTPVTVSGTTLTATVTGLSNGTAYTFQVYATNAIGSGSAATSNVVTAGTPSAPSGVTATAGANQAAVSWTAPASNGGAITGYVVQAFAGSQAQSAIAVGGSATTATLSGLPGGVAYTFQVVAINSFGGGPSSAASAAVTPTGSATTYASTVLGNTPSTYYRLGDPSGTIAADSSGNGSSGAYNGTVTLGGAGILNGDPDRAIALDGSTAYVSAAANAALQGANARTVELWFKTTSTNQQPLFDSGAAGAGQAFVIALTQQNGVGAGPPQSTPGVYVAFGNADIYLPGLNLTDGTPHYLAVTYSGTTVYVYVDGQAVQGAVFNGSSWSAMSSQPFTLPATPNTTANPVWIGHNRSAVWNVGATYFTGTIDEVAVYPAALSGAQVSAHVQAAGYVLAPATNVVATAGANQATVTWTAPTTASSASAMLVTAYLGAQRVNAVGLAPGATSVTISGLQGASSYTFTVVTSNSFGPSPIATSNAVTPTGSGSTYASTVLGDSPAIYYRLGDPSGTLAADSSGNARNAGYQSTPYTLGVAGALGGDSDSAVTITPNCCYYGTLYSGSEVQYPLPAGLPVGNSARSVEAWVKTTSYGTQGVAGWGSTGGLQSFQLAILNGNQVLVTSGPNDTPLVFTSGSTIANGGWHLITVSYDGTTLTLYLDGQSLGTGTFSGPLATSSSTSYGLILGHYFWCGVGCNQYNGSLDEVAIYGTALSSAQVAAHFNASGNGRPTAPPAVTATAGANQATVSWTAATASAGSPVAGYLVTANLNGTQSQNSVGVGGTATSVTVSGLQGGAAYTFTVSAYNNFGYGPASAASASVTPTGSASTYASTVLGDAPSIYYRLGDPSGTVAADSSGSGLNGSYQSRPYTLGVGGALVGDADTSVIIQSDCCYYGTLFNGSEVQYRLTGGLPSGNAARSVEVWVKTTSYGTQGLVGWGNTGGLQSFQVALANGNQIHVLSGPNDTALVFTSGSAIANGSWHLITVSYNGTALTVYLDGQSLGTGTFSGALATSPTTAYGLILGHYFWCGVGCNQYNGSLDEVAIYGTALGPAQVAAHFNASGNGRPTAPTAVTATAGANQATISWTASTASAGSPVTGYLVAANLNGTQSQNAVGAGGSATSATLTGLQGGANYTLTVTAYNNFGAGATSAPSASVATTGTSSTYASTVIGDSPSIYYRLGDPAGTLAADSSSNGRNAYYQGNPYTLGVAGAMVGDSDPAVTILSDCCQYGQPVNGSEVQDKLPAGVPTGNAARSIEVWIKSTNFGTQGLVGWGSTNGHQMFQLRIVSGNRIQLVSWGDDPIFTSGYTITNGSWHLITVTYDGTTLAAYVDGQSIGTATFAGAIGTTFTSGGLVLGHEIWTGVGGDQFNGSMDDVAIYGTALSAAQVASHFNASGNSRPTAPAGVSATAGINQATVTWTASTASSGSPVTGYVVTANLNGTQSQNAIGVGGGTSTIITGLQGGASYTFTVTAVNNFGYGAASAPSGSVTTTGSTSTYASTVLASSPSIYYRLGDPSGILAADSSGNARNANYQSSPYTLGVSGAVVGDPDPAVTIQSGCCYFGQPTGGSEVQYKLPAGLPSGNASRSVEVWVKTTNTGTQGLVGWGTTSDRQAFQLRLVGGNQIQIVTWADDRNFMAPSTIANGFWHHIVLTYDGATLTVYLDSLNIGTTSFSGALATTFSVNGLILGHDVWGGVGTSQFNGSLDEIAIYNSVLTSTQVAAHYVASGSSQNFPGVPTGVSATGGVNQAMVTWTAPSSSGGSAITGYTVTPHAGTTLRTPLTVSGTTTSTAVSGLSGGTTYSFTVTATNSSGTSLDSAASNLVTPTGTVYPYSATVLGDAPVAYWRLGEATGTSATDSSGNGNTGTYAGTVTLAQTGAIRNDPDPAVTLDGVTQSVGVRSSSSLNVTGAISLEAWVKFSSTAGTQQIINKGDGASSSGSAYDLVYVSGTGVSFDTYVSNGSGRAIWRGTPQTGVWYYLVGSRTADGALALYVNGSLVGTANDGGGVVNNINATVGLGASGVGTGSNREPFAGSLDELAVYGSALSATQVALHMQASANRATAPTNVAGTPTAANQITVTWTAPTDGGSTAISGYVVTPHAGATLANPTITSGTATTATVNALSAGTAYYFTVSAVNGSGAGAASVPSTVVTATGTTTYPYTTAVLADGPAGDWRLAETSGSAATDMSGNGNTGTYVAGDTVAQAGAIQRDPATSTKLDGVGGQVLVPNAAVLNITADVSAEAWVKFNSISATQILISKGDGTTSSLSSYQLSYAANNGFVFTTFIGNTATSAVYPMTPALGTWYHVVGTRTAAGLVNIWVDCNLGSRPGEDGGAPLNSTGSALGIGSAGSGTGSRLYPLNGFIQEAAVYNVALTHDRLGAHWGAAGYVPAAPTNVAAVGGQNNAVISWNAPSYPGTSPITGYVLQAYAGGMAVSTPMSVDANTTSFNYAPISGGFTYTFTVTAVNANGSCGPASAQSNAVTVAAPPTLNLGQHLAILTSQVNPLPEGSFGFSTCFTDQCIFQNQFVGPLSQWTIEGYIWGLQSNGVTGGNTAWGVVTTDRLGRPGNYVNPHSASRPIAGINFDIGARAGISSTLQTYFVWPGGQYPIPSDSAGMPVAADYDSNGELKAPAHFALEYDGINVTGFINGVQLFSQAASFGAISGPAGIVDNQELASGIFDEFRISSVARYNTNFTPTTVNFNTDANTTLLWHFDNYALGEIGQAVISTPQDCGRPQVYNANGIFSDAVGAHPANVQYYGTCNFSLGPEVYHALSVGQKPSAAETRTSSGFKTTCDYTPFPVNCATGEFWHSFTDLSIPGRGLPLVLTRSYSSQHASDAGSMGYGWTNSYNMSLAIDGSGNVTVNEENGASVKFTNAGGSLQPPPRTLATLMLSGGQYTFTRKDQAQFVFDSTGRLVKEVDRNHYETLLAYDGSNRLATVTDPGARTLTFHYNASGLIDWVMDPLGRQVLFGYDGTAATACHPVDAPSQCMTSYTDIGGQTTSFSYDSSHRMLTMTDPRSGAITNTYDGQGRVLTQTDQLNRTTQFAYSNGTSTITDPKGNVTVEKYHDNMMISRTKGYGTPQQATWRYTYDPLTLAVASVTDPNGHVATTRYDSRGNIVGACDPLGRCTSATYNTSNDPTSSTDAGGVVSTEAYDSNGNLTSSSRALQGSGQSATAVLTYDPAHAGDVIQFTDANLKTWTRTYNQYGNPVTVTDPLGDKATYVYDTAGRMTSEVSPNGNVAGANPANFTTTYTYNAYNDVTSATDPLNHQTTYVYDADGNLQTVTDANNHTTTYTYDAANQVKLVTRNDNSTQSFVYDLNGNLTQIQDGLHQPTNFTYDSLDRKVSMTDALNRVTSYGYDSVGQLITVTDPMNRTNTLAYDAASQLVSMVYSDGSTPNVRFSYDAMGRVVSMLDGTGTSTYGYDSLYRMVQATDGAGSAVGYGYDLNGHLTTITYPGSGRVVNNTYDSSGRLTGVGDWLGHTTLYKYDANSNLVEQDYPNGVVATSAYDNADRLTSLAHAASGSSFLSLSYSHNNVGELTAENTKTFGYDTISRLTSAQVAGNQSTYAYDNADRLTQVQVAGGNTSTYAYDVANQLQTLTTTLGATQVQKYTYTYDPNGNRTSRTDQSSTSTNYVYDQAGRLISIGSSTQYSYDGSGLRMQKNVGGTVTPFTWNIAGGLDTLILEGQTAYVTGLGGLPLEQITASGQVYYYHADQVGSTRVMTDGSGGVVQTYDYDSYGNPQSSTGTIVNPFQFAGQYTDAESGFQYLRARYYDPSSQSFLTRDPAVLLSPYTYAGSSPQSNSDPTGLDWQSDLSRAGAGARALLDGFPGLASVPYIGTPLSLLAAYNALRQCDFAAASGYLSNVVFNLITGVVTGALGGALGAAAKSEEKAAVSGEGAAQRAAVRGEEKATNAAEQCAINSFSGDTPVLMADGAQKRIDEVRVGDEVMSGDPQGGVQRAEPVVQVIVGHGLKHLYDVHVDGDVIEATNNHPFWVIETQSFVWAQDLLPGEHVLLADGRAPPITAISHHDEITTVYNLSIKDIHTFYVGQVTVLVHNACKATGQWHHVLSNKVFKALEKQPNMHGKFLRSSKDFIVRARNDIAHRGYQTWHRNLDDDLVDWIRSHPTAQPARFLAELRRVYGQPDLRWRFPGVRIPGAP